MKSLLLLLLTLCYAQSAQAVTFVCQNPNGKARVDTAAVVTHENFMGKQKIVVHFPQSVESRDYFYSELTAGTPLLGYAVVEPRIYQRTYGTSKDWFAIDIEQQSKKLPLTLNIYYGLNQKCRTTVRVSIQ